MVEVFAYLKAKTGRARTGAAFSFAVFPIRSHERLARLGGMGKVAGFPDAARR
jgi:hypothetical protein